MSQDRRKKKKKMTEWRDEKLNKQNLTIYFPLPHSTQSLHYKMSLTSWVLI